MTTKTMSAETKTNINEPISSLFNEAKLPKKLLESYLQFLNTDAGNTIQKQLIMFFSQPEKTANFTPIFIYHESQNTISTFMASKHHVPPEPGECGSILSYVRASGKDENYLYSDCYGQLSCSSCAVEILAGTVENPTPREEEYDMLDIDENRPPTDQTRLSCQAKVGSTPLVLKIRK